MVNTASGATFYIYDENLASIPKSSGWLALRTMEDEINHLLSRAESKFGTPNGNRVRNINFKKGKNMIKPRSLRKLIRAIHDLQNRRA